MSKVMTEREVLMHKRFVPINIVVCVLSLVAILTLFFTPLLRVDVGKILSDEGSIQYLSDVIDESIGKDINNESGVDYSSAVTKIVKRVLSKSQGVLSITGSGAMSVAMAGNGKGEKAMDELLFGPDGLVTELIESVVSGVVDLIGSQDGRGLIEQTMVNAIISAFTQDNPEIAEMLGDGIDRIVDAFRELEGVENGDISGVAQNIFASIENVTGQTLTQSEMDGIYEEIQFIYDTTSSHLGEDESVTFESIVCVALSSNVDLDKFDLGNLFGNILGDDESDEGDEHNVARTLNEGGDSERTIVTSYDGLLNEMGFGPDEREQLKANVTASIKKSINSETSSYAEYFEFYAYVFYAVLFFTIPWMLQLLFAFIRIFTKNKRVRMWYVKLLCWLAPLVWIAITALPSILDSIAPDMFSGKEGPLLKAAVNNIGSYTWISGLCLIGIWVASIWAGTIRRRIKRERDIPLEEGAAAGTAAVKTKKSKDKAGKVNANAELPAEDSIPVVNNFTRPSDMDLDIAAAAVPPSYDPPETMNVADTATELPEE